MIEKRRLRKACRATWKEGKSSGTQRARERAIVEKRLAASVLCSATRLKRARAAEAQVKQLQQKACALQACIKKFEEKESAASEAVAHQEAVPVLHLQRAPGKTNGGMALPSAKLALTFGQLVRLTPPRAVGPLICLRLCAALRRGSRTRSPPLTQSAKFAAK
eukprot:6213644-Pleurochrysis_carterae.AAC.3